MSIPRDASEFASHAHPDLSAVEIRADLLPTPEPAFQALKELSERFKTVFTLRRTAEGGGYSGDESRRQALYELALANGAAAIDVEWGTPASAALCKKGAPVILSHHRFDRMLDNDELLKLTAAMEDLQPIALKVVPTAETPLDSCRMLDWVSGRPRASPARIGFAMGEPGLPSRILTLSCGGALTYGSVRAAVAPGQLSAHELLSLYRVEGIPAGRRTLGVVGHPVGHSLSPHMHNPALQCRGINYTYVPIGAKNWNHVMEALDPLRVDGLSVTIPHKESALSCATRAEPSASAAGAANTLTILRRGGRREIHAANTDIEGVIGPLRRRSVDFRRVHAAVVGNGGAARGACQALIAAGAAVKLYFRNPDRGEPVAAALGVPGAELSQLTAGAHDLIINATPLGLREDDPSPVSAETFVPGTIAFDMVYSAQETEFLRAAAAGGAQVVRGGEMLVTQALAQFLLFTGQQATFEEFSAAFEDGLEQRRATQAR